MTAKNKLSKFEEKCWKLAEEELNEYIDPIWETIYINGEPTEYIINRLGEVVNTDTDHYMAQNKNEFGYLRTKIRFNGKSYDFKVHRLVAETFIQNPDNKPEVNHIDADKTHNWYKNLEWVTSKENKQHAIKHGLYDNASFHTRGTERSTATHTEEQAHTVCKLASQGKTPKEITKLANVEITFVNSILYSGRWPHIYSQYDIPQSRKFKHNPLFEYKQQIDEMIMNGETDVDKILLNLGLAINKQRRQYVMERKHYVLKKQGSTTIEH